MWVVKGKQKDREVSFYLYSLFVCLFVQFLCTTLPASPFIFSNLPSNLIQSLSVFPSLSYADRMTEDFFGGGRGVGH